MKSNKIEKNLKNKSSSEAVVPNKYFVSKLRKFDKDKMKDYKMILNRLKYLYAEENGSKIPRMNAYKDEDL